MKTQDLFNQQKPIQYANPIIHATMKTSIDKELSSNEEAYRNELVDIEQFQYLKYYNEYGF